MGNRTPDLQAVPSRDPGWQVFTEIPEEIASIVFRVFKNSHSVLFVLQPEVGNSKLLRRLITLPILTASRPSVCFRFAVLAFDVRAMKQ